MFKTVKVTPATFAPFCPPLIFKKNKFQTKHSNLDISNAYPQLDTNTRLEMLGTIYPIAIKYDQLDSEQRAPRERSTFE